MAPTPSGDRWATLEQLFLAAAELSGDERQRFLAERCGGDDRLREEVEALLREDAPGADEFVRRIVVPAAEATAAEAQTRQRIGPYRVLDQLGAGGMGAVYRGRRDDGAFTREVAIKVLPLGLDSADARERFRQERQILASLEHPSIARLTDGGETDAGLPYLVLELAASARTTIRAASRCGRT
jgi:serine/threonine protein kinase